MLLAGYGIANDPATVAEVQNAVMILALVVIDWLIALLQGRGKINEPD